MVEILVYSYYIRDSINFLKRIANVFLKYDITVYRLHNKLRVGDLTFIAYCEANHRQIETGRSKTYCIGASYEATDEEVEKQIISLVKQIYEENWLGGKKC